MILALDVADRQRASVATHRQAGAFRDRHKSTQKRSLHEIVLRRIVR